MLTVGERIGEIMRKRGISQNKLAKDAGISQSGLSSILSGDSSPKESTLKAIADALGCNVWDFYDVVDKGYIAYEQESGKYVRLFPDFVMMKQNAVPIVGDIACGKPITAQQNIDGYADLPEGVHADFALRCKGNSMTPTFNNGDIVLIRQQPEVEDGQIAAISIEGEATLKHVYKQPGGLLLVADNPKYPPLQVKASEEIVIHGLAIGYTRLFEG